MSWEIAFVFPKQFYFTQNFTNRRGMRRERDKLKDEAGSMAAKLTLFKANIQREKKCMQYATVVKYGRPRIDHELI